MLKGTATTPTGLAPRDPLNLGLRVGLVALRILRPLPPGIRGAMASQLFGGGFPYPVPPPLLEDRPTPVIDLANNSRPEMWEPCSQSSFIAKDHATHFRETEAAPTCDRWASDLLPSIWPRHQLLAILLP